MRSRSANPEMDVVFFKEMARGQELFAGGKGGTLAKLCQRGYKVPDGLVILSGAFSGDEPTAEAWSLIRRHTARLRSRARGGDSASFAVRSSAVGEDSAEASFAGAFESVLDVRTDEEILEAIRRVRRSRHADRVAAYGEAQGLPRREQEVAVVVQRFIHADFAGVLFTVDPVSGDTALMAGNFVHGSGDSLVSGQANPLSFTLSRPGGRYEGPAELMRIAPELYRTARRIERQLGGPQDIEFALAAGRLSILQSRPITTLNAYRADTCEWNDSRTGRFLWSATNLAEQAPEVRTPFSCSMLKALDSLPALRIGSHSLTGIIGGRAYSNLSVLVSAYRPLFGGNTQRALKMLRATFGDIPEDIDIPIVPLSPWTWWTKVLPGLLAYVRRMRRLTREIPGFVEKNPSWCSDLRALIGQTGTAPELDALWKDEIEPHLRRSLLLLYASTIDISPRLERKLRELVGQEDADVLLSNASGLSGGLESLGPVTGIAGVARGSMSRAAYMEAYGHRGVNEFEYAWPRPMEDPAWLDRQLAELEKGGLDVDALLSRQRAAYEAAWARFVARYPRMAEGMNRSLVRAASVARRREAIRSEAIRCMAVVRAFALRAGEVSGVGQDVFLLTIGEVRGLLAGDTGAIRLVGLRKETLERYRALPQYPGIILGRFDPFKWAADPQRRADIFLADAPAVLRGAARDGAIKGIAGAPGVVEGVVRRLERIEESGSFRTGEVLVTPMTNIGWTLLFPRAAAIVTDIGAPLSHASIVARELGIPAVVGCGDATTRLKTGDRVRVDGSGGIVELV